MVIPLGEDSCVSIPPTVLSEISELDRSQSEAVQAELEKITSAEHAPSKFIYKQYGDLKVFRCGSVIRLFGVVLENIELVDDFDHLVILLEVSEHDYDQAGASKKQAQSIQDAFGDIGSEQEFWDQLEGKVFDNSDISKIF